MSAAAISSNGLHVCFADKFGVIWVVDLDGGVDGNQPLVSKKAMSLLSHYCSIITSLVSSSLLPIPVSVFSHVFLASPAN